MKKRYELQILSGRGRWYRSAFDVETPSLGEKISRVVGEERMEHPITYRVVQKLGRKVIKVVYPKGDKQ